MGAGPYVAVVARLNGSGRPRQAALVAAFGGAKPHALHASAERLRALGGEHARIDADPTDLRRQAAVFDFRTAVHDHSKTGRKSNTAACRRRSVGSASI